MQNTCCVITASLKFRRSYDGSWVYMIKGAEQECWILHGITNAHIILIIITFQGLGV